MPTAAWQRRTNRRWKSSSIGPARGLAPGTSCFRARGALRRESTAGSATCLTTCPPLPRWVLTYCICRRSIPSARRFARLGSGTEVRPLQAALYPDIRQDIFRRRGGRLQSAGAQAGHDRGRSHGRRSASVRISAGAPAFRARSSGGPLNPPNHGFQLAGRRRSAGRSGPGRSGAGQGARTRPRGDHKSIKSRVGSSSASLIRTRKVTASRPSTRRWS